MISENAERAAAEAGSGRGKPWRGRTHCGYGHPYDDANTAYRTDSTAGARRCIECKRRHGREWYARRGRELRKARRAMKAAGE
jgi:hypothetical protein